MILEEELEDTKDFEIKLNMIERICHLICENDDKYLDNIKKYFRRSAEEYKLLQSEQLLFDKNVIEQAYKDTLQYMEVTGCDSRRK